MFPRLHIYLIFSSPPLLLLLKSLTRTTENILSMITWLTKIFVRKIFMTKINLNYINACTYNDLFYPLCNLLHILHCPGTYNCPGNQDFLQRY
ncbi:hypothetical protein KsCSTR_11990 [Candidatus Kuenenia stuttgartiensis]|uniref:Uncharacterized protein n=1 Tax=Kuenenia stuttgartiensis TaxID=174633 RepID=Q1PYA5_KUEST|nr:hypothetical protein KsCSTR_11990 [Candidatus Kuenenia stuttgartiensis]CAJ72068.1 unknown protein [Candidatus Kuenenia stuttgartiensis]